MQIFFLVCAAIGGTILVLQFIMTLLGMAGDSMTADVPHDVGGDFGGADHGFGGDVHADGGDLHGDAAGHDVQAGDHDVQAGQDAHQTTHAAAQHGTMWLFKALSFRTIVAAMAFFGLAGLAAQSAEASTPMTLGIALAAGLAAMYAVYGLMQLMYSLRAEGTVHIQRAVGREGTVYLRIPRNNSGSGKIHLNLQNRTMEYLAVTSGEAIPTGATVVVTDVIGSDTVQVEPASAEYEAPSTEC